MSNFVKELETLINRCSMENGSDTPDFILASYLFNCLAIYNTAIKQRDKYYGFLQSTPVDLTSNPNADIGL